MFSIKGAGELQQLQIKIDHLTAERALLTKERDLLSREKEVLAPLVQVGAAVRLRSLELARDKLFDNPAPVDPIIIRQGNDAAHRGNGVADAALFQAGFVSNDRYGVAAGTFGGLYECLPQNYNWNIQARRLLHCEATLLMLKSIDDSEDVDMEYKKHDSVCERLRGI